MKRHCVTSCCESPRWSTAAPEIQELDLNPVMVLSSGACVADVRLRVEAATPAAARAARRVLTRRPSAWLARGFRDEGLRQATHGKEFTLAGNMPREGNGDLQAPEKRTSWRDRCRVRLR